MYAFVTSGKTADEREIFDASLEGRDLVAERNRAEHRLKLMEMGGEVR